MRKKILWTLLLIPLVLSLVPAIVSAPPPTYLYVDPDFMWCEPGKEFSVDITLSYIAKSQYLWSYQLELYVDPDVLKPVNWENGPFLESSGGEAFFVEGQGFDEATGKLWLFGGYIDVYPPHAPEGYDGVLAIVTFEVVGLGDSDIVIGDHALVDMANRYITIDTPEHGALHSEYGPELYLRRRGAHGGGVWPEWHVGLFGTTQTLYARIRNYGTVGAYVMVIFELRAPGMTPPPVFSNLAWIEPRNPIDGEPGEVVVYGTCTGPPADYEVKGYLGFIAGPFTSVTYWGSDMVGLGGEADTRDTATKFKVVTTM